MITVINSFASSYFNPVNTSTLTLSFTPTNGNTLLLLVSDVASTITSITQTGATWVQDLTFTGAGGSKLNIWRASNVTGASTSITINTAGVDAGIFQVIEATSLDNTSPLGQTATNTASIPAGAQTITADSGTTATTTSANELWFGGLDVVGSSSNNTDTMGSPSNGFTKITDSSDTTGGNHGSGNYKIVSTTGTANTSAGTSPASVVYNGGASWVGVMATYKQAAATKKSSLLKMGKGIHVQTTSQISLDERG